MTYVKIRTPISLNRSQHRPVRLVQEDVRVGAATAIKNHPRMSHHSGRVCEPWTIDVTMKKKTLELGGCLGIVA
jgi:hypothetical protein